MPQMVAKTSETHGIYPKANLQNPSVVKILLAAAESFARSGYQGATTKEISLRAGVSKSLLHYHFQSKEHLLYELQSMIFRTVAERIRQLSLKGKPSMDQALRALDEVWKMIEGVRAYIPLAFDLWNLAATQEQLRPQQEALMSEGISLLEEAIHQTLGPLAGRLEIPVPRVAQLLMAVFPGLAIRLQMDPESARLAFEDFKTLVVKLIADPPGPSQR